MTDTMPQSAAAPSPFPPIADYAFISDCHTGALIAPDGAVDWLCAPRFDAPSSFGSLLDRGAGTFRFGPYGINVPTARVYEPGTNVVETTWKTPTGWIRVREALTIGPRTHEDTVTPHTRPPTDEDADHMLVRTVVCIEGEVEVELVCEPAFDYGREPATWQLAEDGQAHMADATGAGQTIRLATDMVLGIEGTRVRARHVLAAGDRAFCSLSWAENLESPTDVDDAERRLDVTARFWRKWLGRGRFPDHRWREPIQRSALTIKGLTFMPTGATVAALTTSLPETPGGERNWDYRYSWMRDSTFTLQALHFLNLDWEADEFMQFVADLEPNEDGSLQIMYGIDGRARPDRVDPRRSLGVCRGAAGADRKRRVRPAPERCVRGRARLDPAAHPPQPAAAPPAVADRRSPGRVRHQRVAAARPGHLGGAGSAPALRLVQADVLGGARPGGQAGRHPGATSEYRQKWGATAEEIRQDILAHGLSERGVLRQHYNTDSLDASTLLAATLRLPAA